MNTNRIHERIIRHWNRFQFYFLIRWYKYSRYWHDFTNLQHLQWLDGVGLNEKSVVRF